MTSSKGYNCITSSVNLSELQVIHSKHSSCIKCNFLSLFKFNKIMQSCSYKWNTPTGIHPPITRAQFCVQRQYILRILIEIKQSNICVNKKWTVEENRAKICTKKVSIHCETKETSVISWRPIRAIHKRPNTFIGW